MSEYIKSKLLCIGGLEFRFPDDIYWPEEGELFCYRPFIDGQGESVGAQDIINVTLHSGIPSDCDSASGIMDSGEGIRWFMSGENHVVQQILPHISLEPLWEIRMSVEERLAKIYFSDKHLQNNPKEGGWPVAAPCYPIDQHMAMHFLAGCGGALIHSAGISYRGKGFMCSGVSGAGKTTTSRLLADHGEFKILTDDRVIVRFGANGAVTMHGTPWTGEGRYATAGVSPLAAVFFLKQDSVVKAERLKVVDVVARFLPVVSVPWFSEKLMTQTLETIEKLAGVVPAYDLHFTKTSETMEVIRNILDGRHGH